MQACRRAVTAVTAVTAAAAADVDAALVQCSDRYCLIHEAHEAYEQHTTDARDHTLTNGSSFVWLVYHLFFLKKRYPGHYKLITSAIWSKYPNMTIIASGRWGPSIDGSPCLTGQRCDAWDDHYYRTPDVMAAMG